MLSAPPTCGAGPLVTSSLENGLGNQLFQVANAYAHARDIGGEAIFPHSGIEHLAEPSPVLSRINRYDGPELNQLPVLGEWGVDRTDQLDSVKFQGLFQNPKFFDHHREELIQLFNPTEEIRTQLVEKYKHLLNQNTVAIHVRRGDYLTFKIGDDKIMYNLSEDSDYYEQALKYFDPEQHHFVIFSNDIEFTKNMPAFKHLKYVTYVDKQKPHEDFYLMSFCKNHIIANSTFSWWAAYIGKQLNQKVIMPLKWWHADIAKKWNDPRAEHPFACYGLLMSDWIKA